MQYQEINEQKQTQLAFYVMFGKMTVSLKCITVNITTAAI